jgi:hypothetical protein
MSVIKALLLLALLLPTGAEAVSSRKLCQRACKPQLADCVLARRKVHRCKTAALKRCRREGPATCGTTTTTTSSITTTTLSGGTNPGSCANEICLNARLVSPGIVEITWSVSPQVVARGGRFFTLELYVGRPTLEWRDQVSTEALTDEGIPVRLNIGELTQYCFRMVATSEPTPPPGDSFEILGEGRAGNAYPCM